VVHYTLKGREKRIGEGVTKEAGKKESYLLDYWLTKMMMSGLWRKKAMGMKGTNKGRS